MTYTEDEYQEKIDFLVEVIEEEHDPIDNDDIHNEIFTETDQLIAGNDFEDNLSILQASDTEPHDWHHLVGDTQSHERVIQVMAFRVVEQDIMNEIRENTDIER